MKDSALQGDRPFEKFLEAVPDAVVAVDRGGTIVAVNLQAESLFGYNRGDMIGSAATRAGRRSPWRSA
jgi:PAS domain S-box-containing protein